jgi:phospholipid transport system substrate-binding protein
MKKHALWMIPLLAAWVTVSSLAFAETPLETVRTQVNKLLEVLSDPALKAASARETKEKKLWTIIDAVFDYSELSARTLAQYWKIFTPEQKEEFTRLFGKLLGNAYMDRIMAYSNEKVVFGKTAKLSENISEVQTEVVTASRSVPISYRMILKDGHWRVFDVVIEGVSLVQNYRTQFREILQNKSPEDLIKILREKVARQDPVRSS